MRRTLKRHAATISDFFTWVVMLALAALVLLVFAVNAQANPQPHGQELIIEAGGAATTRGYADGAAEATSVLYWNGTWHTERSCRRSTWSVHLWICEGFQVTPGRSAYGRVLYRNSNGYSIGYTPWVWSSCCSRNSAVNGVIG